MQKTLSTPIQYLKGIGPKRAKILNKIGLSTIEDLLYYFPRRYEDRTRLLTISQLKEKEEQTIKAVVLAKGERTSWRRRGFNIIQVAVGDATGKIFCVWFNQPYLKDYFKVGQTLVLHGRVERYKNRLQMSSPEFEIVSKEEDEPRPCPALARKSGACAQEGDESLSVGRVVPIYGLPQGITQRYFRQIVKHCLDEYLPAVNDFLPYDIRARNHLFNLAKSLLNIHFPQNLNTQKESYCRLSFEEFFLFQLPLALRKSKKKERQGIAHKVEGELVKNFIASLPFKLTSSQEKVIEEIKQDLAQAFSMQRLLQGDVGSGKTVVATIASLMAIQGGYQTAFLVPTEILAKQHHSVVSNQVSGMRENIKIALLTSSLNKKEKVRIYQEIKDGNIDLIIATHALLEESVNFKNLGLVVIDEQHKFGVGQRALLPEKGKNPDVLIMTATPIPRTLAITLYGDLDISVINELPAGRKPITTQWIGKDKRDWLYNFVRDNIQKGRQAYVVYPIIEESFSLDLLSAKEMYVELKNNVFKEFNLGLIHGRLRQPEQDRIMSEFRQGRVHILIATTVLEVGIDVSNASIMIIEHAERFGLSQLHQLRGRIGRGPYESFCILISDAVSSDARLRLETMVKYRDGFRIAEEDLKIRGAGEFFGQRQHGLTELRIANPLTQMQLLKRAREEAIRLINLDPKLEMRQDLLLKEKLLQRFPEYEKLMMVG